AGLSSLPGAGRLAPGLPALPAKSLIAVLLAGLAFAGEMGWAAPSPSLTPAALLVARLLVLRRLLPLRLLTAAPAGAAAAPAGLLSWSHGARRAVGRWLAVAALQEGDPAGAMKAAVDPDDLLLAQVLALEGRWREAIEHASKVARA